MTKQKNILNIMVTLQSINENLTTLKKSSLFNSVREWAHARNLIKGGNVLTQRVKLYEELGEMCRGVVKNDEKLIKDSIGDSIVVCINLLCIAGIEAESLISEIEAAHNPDIDQEVLKMSEKQVSLDCFTVISMHSEFAIAFNNLLCCLAHIAIIRKTNLSECLEIAYNEIKDRKGKMVDGSFVKEE